jgi:hypothetical protein
VGLSHSSIAVPGNQLDRPRTGPTRTLSYVRHLPQRLVGCGAAAARHDFLRPR